MLDVLCLTLDDRVDAFVQVDQLFDQSFPGRLLLLPCLGLPGLRQSFPGRAVQLDPPLHLRNILELIFNDRSNNVGKFNCFQIIPISWDTRNTLVCPETQVFQCRWTTTEESLISFAQRGTDLTFRPFRVCRVSAMMITLSFTSVSCDKNVSKRTHSERSLRVIVRKWEV